MNGFINHAVRFNEYDALFRAFDNPEDKIGIEAFVFIEADSFAATLIAQEEHPF